MRQNYFKKLMKYIKKVYNIDKQINTLTDGRINPSYNTGKVMLPVILGFLLRIKSLNELNCMLKENEFKKLLPKGDRLPLIDTIRDTLKSIDLNSLENINRNIIKKAIENKVFINGTINGYTVAALDGTKIFGSNKKSCPKCLTTEIKGKPHHYHSGVVMSLVGNAPNLVLDYEMYNCKIDSKKKDEGELTVSKRLRSRVLSKQKNFVDIVTYDALACNSKFINHCIELRVDTVVRVKQNNNNAIKDIKRRVNKKDTSEVWKNKGERIEVYEGIFYMSGVKQPLRFVKYAKQKNKTERSQMLIVTTCIDMSLETLYKIIKARWEIENSIFNNLKNEAAMGHCFVHGGNAIEAVLYCIFITSNLFQLFRMRRIKNHVKIQKELIRLLLKGLYLLKRDKSLIFDTT